MTQCGRAMHACAARESLRKSRLAVLVCLITPCAPEDKRARPPFGVQTMLRIHFMQQWSTLSDPAMEKSLHHVPLFREFSGLRWDTAVPDETTIHADRKATAQRTKSVSRIYCAPSPPINAHCADLP